MDIFESLENLEVSESCFDDIMSMVEECINEDLFKEGDSPFTKAVKKGIDMVAKPGEIIKKAGNKVLDKASDAVTNMKGPIGDKIRQTKIARKTLGNRALKNAQKDINRAKGDWNNVVKDQMASYAGQPEHHYSDGVKKATQKAIDTEKKWGARIHY